VREITSLDSKLPDQTEVHIRTDLRSDILEEIEKEVKWGHVTYICKGSQCVLSSVLTKVISAVFYV